MGCGKAWTSRNSNAARNSRRMIKRYGLNWKVPISELFYEAEGQDPVSIPYISPTNLMKYLLESHRELLLGGFQNLSDGVSLLKGWWKYFRNTHPNHSVFGEHDEAALGYTIPLYLYGDEGKGKKRGNTAVFTVEPPFGLDSAFMKKNNDHCLDCATCGPGADTQEKFKNCRCSTSRDVIGFATSNLKEHSFMSKFLLWVIPCELYKQYPDLIPFVVKHISQELRALFYEGIVVENRTWTFAVCGMKGDNKWHNALGNFTRHFGTKGRKRDLLMCYECMAGSSQMPYEDISFEPSWKDTRFTVRPWRIPPPVSLCPFDSNEGERMLKRDIFHIMKVGCMRHYVGSVLVTLIAWGYFQILPMPPEGNSADVQLQRSYGHFRLWCATFSKTPSLRSFSRRLFNWPSYKAYAWANTKGSDTVLLCDWLVTLLGQLLAQPLTDETHRPVLDVMRQVGLAAKGLIGVVYTHQLLLRRCCAMQVYEHGTVFLNGYCWLAQQSMHFGLCAWAVVPKIHMLRHTTLELQEFLRGNQDKFVSPLVAACDQNEDVIGKVCSLYLKVQTRYSMKRVLELYLVKAKILQRRWAERAENWHRNWVSCLWCRTPASIAMAMAGKMTMGRVLAAPLFWSSSWSLSWYHCPLWSIEIR